MQDSFIDTNLFKINKEKTIVDYQIFFNRKKSKFNSEILVFSLL